jgi:hypothetical protein
VLGMMAHTYTSSTRETEAGRLWVQCQPGVYNKKGGKKQSSCYMARRQNWPIVHVAVRKVIPSEITSAQKKILGPAAVQIKFYFLIWVLFTHVNSVFGNPSYYKLRCLHFL